MLQWMYLESQMSFTILETRLQLLRCIEHCFSGATAEQGSNHESYAGVFWHWFQDIGKDRINHAHDFEVSP